MKDCINRHVTNFDHMLTILWGGETVMGTDGVGMGWRLRQFLSPSSSSLLPSTPACGDGVETETVLVPKQLKPSSFNTS